MNAKIVVAVLAGFAVGWMLARQTKPAAKPANGVKIPIIPFSPALM